MQINDLFGRAAAFETARLPDGTAAVLPAEHAAALYVNEQPAFRVVCTPELDHFGTDCGLLYLLCRRAEGERLPEPSADGPQCSGAGGVQLLYG